MNDRALTIISKKIEQYESYLREAFHEWPDDERQELTYSKWALEEMLQLVWDHPWTPASETIDQFGTLMMIYGASTDSDDQRRIFQYAAHEAWEVFDIAKEEEL